MPQSDKIFSLARLLDEAGELGPSLRWSLLRHVSELMLDLPHTVALDPVVLPPPLEGDDGSDSVLEEETPVQSLGALALSEYGDEAALHEVRMEALHVFETREFSEESMVAIWLDVVQFWGHPLLVCMGVNVEGYRRVLGFAESSLQVICVKRLIQDVLDRGLGVDAGLLWIIPGLDALSSLLTDWFGPRIRVQHCQVQKCARVVGLVPESEQREVQGALRRAFEIPGPKAARAALMQIHADLSNRSAAQSLLKNVDQTLTVHQSGLYQYLSSSLRNTRCIARTGRFLNQRVRGIRHWLPPQTRRAQIALLLLETELHTRRLAHASYLSSMQNALFSKKVKRESSTP